MRRYDVIEMGGRETASGAFEDVIIVEGTHWDNAQSHARARARNNGGDTVFVTVHGSDKIEDIVMYVFVDEDTGALITEEA